MLYKEKEKLILHKINHNLKLKINHGHKRIRDLYKIQQRLILFNHVNKCKDYTCCYLNQACNTIRNMWEHVLCCNNINCVVPYCKSSKLVINHHYKCTNISCVVCEPSRKIYNPIYCQLTDAANILCTFIEK